jgi:hypothetical protein
MEAARRSARAGAAYCHGGRRRLPSASTAAGGVRIVPAPACSGARTRSLSTNFNVLKTTRIFVFAASKLSSVDECRLGAGMRAIEG